MRVLHKTAFAAILVVATAVAMKPLYSKVGAQNMNTTQRRVEMPIWEYKELVSVRSSANPGDWYVYENQNGQSVSRSPYLIQSFNQLGTQGWELIGCYPLAVAVSIGAGGASPTEQVHCFLKKPKM